MLAKIHSAVSKMRVRQREATRRHAQRRTLRAEPLEGRLLLSVDSWVVPSGLQGSDAGHREVEADAEGNVYVAATVQTDAGRLSLAKYSPEGALLWKNELMTGDGQTVWDAAVAADGVYIAGEFGGSVDFDPNSPVGSMQSQGASDGYVAKYSVDGAFEWSLQFGGSQSEYLRSVEVQDGNVYITGHLTTNVDRKNTRSDLLVAKLSGDGEELWRKEIPNGWGHGIAVYKPTTEPATIYVTGDGYNYPNLGPVTLPSYFIMSMSESTDGRDVATEWVVGLATRVGRLAVTPEEDGSTGQVPRIYVASYAGGGDLLKLDDTGSVLWSQHVTSDSLSLWDVAVDANVVYLAGGFGGSADFDQEATNPVLISRGIRDGFLARYDTVDGHLLALQRMGGNNVYQDTWSGLDAANGRVYLSGRFSGPVVDLPVGLAGQMSAFVPTTTIKELFTLQLDAAAPIVQVADTDISATENTPVTLTATTSAGTITWYEEDESGVPVPLQDADLKTPGMDLNLLVGTHQISAIATDAEGRIGMAGVVVTVAAAAPITKFYVVNDATANQTFEYSASGSLVESYNLITGNTAPRGAASNADGTKTWVVDANRKVYVYDTEGGLLGSWTAGTIATNATVEGIAVSGNDVWIVDAKSDKVYKYAGAAAEMPSGTRTASSIFPLNSSNTSPKDLVTDGTSLWVVNDSTTDKVFKYNAMTGSLVGSWTISGGGGSPTGITLDPSNANQDLWIVDSASDKVYQVTNGRTSTSATQIATAVIALAVGNTNPQGIADPPVPSSLLTTETAVLSEPVSAEAALRGNDAALASMYYEPLKKIRVDTVRRSESRVVESHTRDLGFTVGFSANRLANDSVANDKHHMEVDDLFAQWDSDPLEMLSVPDLGA